ncbi:chromosome segregation protein SMC [Neptunicella sp. SCSIO 80796]|uniref:chromosome segregation protein SMC n=1 Tax=Neptunicella plasticusilytica TaxID=3117012 RepID=UPI003A4E623F
MRLKKIRLAGFKSFVDPTNIPFPDDMTAIVGPNGCGKSNVIDAVRWVLGESSAKNLRGDAMTDVIFNGSTARKPVSQSSVELVFENASERLQGEYAKYNELSIKRVVTREAISSYFLNGSKCRRRDVTDLFLGTGLGPRSYAIIEQGMISRLIESKPQELRIFIEEAAGISKYKERRRETENRIRHTKDNLERLADVRGELGQQLEKLQRQASAAKRYRDLKAQERELKGQLAALRWIKYSDLIESLESQIEQVENQLQAFIAEQRGSEKGMLSYQDKQQDLKQQLDDLQQQMFKLGNDITRLEQSQIHHKVRSQQIRQELQKLDDDIQEHQQHYQQEMDLLEELQAQLDMLQPDAEVLEQQLEQAVMQLETQEQQFEQQQNNWRQQEQQLQQQQQQQQLLEGKQQSLQSMQARSRERLAELDSELSGLSDNEDNQQLSDLEQQVERAEQQYQQTKQQLEQDNQQAEIEQTALKTAENNLLELTGRQQKLEAESASLTVLQASGQSDKKLQQWLSEQQIDHQPLWQYLQVQSGWQIAVETALQHWLQNSLLEQQCDLPDIVGSRLLFADRLTSAKPAGSLAAKLDNRTVPEQLCQIQVTDSIELANQMVLQAGQSVITREGYWRGADWAILGSQSEHNGMLERAQKLELNQQQQAELAQQRQVLQQEVEMRQQTVTQQRDAMQLAQSLLQEQYEAAGTLRSQFLVAEQRQQQTRQRQDRLQSERLRVEQQLQEEQLQQEEIAQQQEELLFRLEELQQHQPDISAERERGMQQIQQHRQQVEQIKNRQHQQALQLQGISSQLHSRTEGMNRSQKLVGQMTERQSSLTSELQEMTSPLEDQEIQLQEWLAQRSELESMRSALADELAEVESFLADNQKGQQAVVDKISQLRGQQESLRVECEGHRVRANAVVEQLPEIDMGLKELLENMPEEAEEKQWQERLEKIGQSVVRLGAVNLAAVEEYEIQSVRKAHLDEQHEDLTSALDTLEGAIRKIDKETRSRFKQTFTQVNSDLQVLFPKVFGGGAASLELTDDDLLETGVTIMAQPPGKKNSTIHLLSGGEKALTALSLVFAIFRLNPAPFCLLDEVDAPLDDANVVRFCKLVSEMSKSVQFIYITHNKIAMEMASHLTGVTMAEPGVSRMVAVDVEEAVALAEA